MQYIVLTRNIELNILLFGFMLNFIWEMLQMPLFSFYDEASVIGINIACIQASAGDALMLVVAYWILAGLLKSRQWIFHLNSKRMIMFLVPGIVFTIMAEALATGPLHRWEYAELMPTLPYLGTGLVPIVQWLILPPLVLLVVKRRLS